MFNIGLLADILISNSFNKKKNNKSCVICDNVEGSKKKPL